MRKLFLVLGLFMAANTFAKDEITDKKTLFGFNIGTSANTAKFEDENNNKAKNRTKVGGFAAFTFEGRLAKSFSLETGVSYVNKGSSQKLSDPAIIGGNGKVYVVNNGRNTLNLHSLEIPLIAKVYIGKKKIFNVNAGGFFSYAFKINMTSTGKDIGTKKNVTVKNDKLEILGEQIFNPIDAGINLGVEFISQKGFGAGFKVNQGFIDGISKEITHDKKMLNTGAQLYFIAKF